MEQKQFTEKDRIQLLITELLQTSSGDQTDLAYAVYELIEQSEHFKPELFMFFIETSEDLDTSEEKRIEKIFSEEEKYQYARDYGKIIDGTLEALLKKHYEKEKFYQELWNFIEENPLLDTKKLKAFALFYIWVDIRLPYYVLDDGIKMSDDDYQDICQKLSEDIKKARFILHVPTEQKTERASRIVKLLESLQDDKEKAVLMAHILKLSDHSDMILNRLAIRAEKLSKNEIS